MTAHAMPLLVAQGLTGGYGKLDILHDVSLTVNVGEIVSIIGPNGAGKSTAFKTIVGFLRPRRGTVSFNGEAITGLRPDLVLRRGLAYVPQGRIVFPDMTVLENLEMGAYIERERARVTAALERVYGCFRSCTSAAPSVRGRCRGRAADGRHRALSLMTSPQLSCSMSPPSGCRQSSSRSSSTSSRDEARRFPADGRGAERDARARHRDRAYVAELGRTASRAPDRVCWRTRR